MVSNRAKCLPVTPCFFFSLSSSGLCLEKVPAASPSLSNKNAGSPASNRTMTEREQEIITCYEKSGDIALLYLQEAEKVCCQAVMASQSAVFSLHVVVFHCPYGRVMNILLTAFEFDWCATALDGQLANKSLRLYLPRAQTEQTAVKLRRMQLKYSNLDVVILVRNSIMYLRHRWENLLFILKQKSSLSNAETGDIWLFVETLIPETCIAYLLTSFLLVF